MEGTFNKRATILYTNFIKFIIPFSLFHIFICLIENSTIIYIIDIMFSRDEILNQLFTPLYFISPHLYIDIFNEKFENECEKIFQYSQKAYDETHEEEEDEQDSSSIISEVISNIISDSNEEDRDKNFSSSATEEEKQPMIYEMFTKNTRYYTIEFRGSKLYETDNSYCVYNSKLIIFVISIILFTTILFILLLLLNTRGKPPLWKKIVVLLLTNFINIVIRPFFSFISIILMNRPLVYLYKSKYIKSSYKTQEILYCFLSLFFLFYIGALAYLYEDIMTNLFCFETFPYNSFDSGESNVMMVIKIFIGFKVTYDKMMGINKFKVINLICGLFIFMRVMYTVGGERDYVVNHLYLRNFNIIISLFSCLLITLKLINQYVNYFQTYSKINFTLEIAIIFVVLLAGYFKFGKFDDEFIFCKEDDFMAESMRFMYFINKNFPKKDLNVYNEKKKDIEKFIDKIIIGHKMKCKMEECIICREDIYNPDLKTLSLILYQQFLENEKDYKEENEGLTLIVKLLYLKMIDENKIHRIAFVIMKNLKNQNLDINTLLKISYLYQKNLDELNTDLKGLLSMKYSEVNDSLLACIKNFEEILGFIKTRTEKVELVTTKTNILGTLYETLINDLTFLKKNKRIFFDSSSFLQLICLTRLLFPQTLNNDLTDGLDYNFTDFLEYVDREFAENISFLLKYDFNNKSWRIKKIPKKFIDITHYKINELLDQSLEKIFPKVLAKSRIKSLENDIILNNVIDTKLEFKTVICDSETNARYVKFIINIIPHLENSFLLNMFCHFHKRQLIIIDENGNFINGSDLLYNKVGINADIVAASKGRINMFTMFNLDKKQKLEDVKIVSISKEGVVDATKNIFLLENNANENSKKKLTKAPSFLNTFIKNEVINSDFKKDKSVVFLQLFSKEVINDVKYYIFNIKISNPDEKKNKQSNNNINNKSDDKIKHSNSENSWSSENKEMLGKINNEKNKDENEEEEKEDDENSKKA